jgi:IPT/TIG domain
MQHQKRRGRITSAIRSALDAGRPTNAVVVVTVVLGALGVSTALTVHNAGATLRPMLASGGTSGTVVHQPLNPVSGNQGFAQVRGEGYEQALVEAHQKAAALPKAAAPLTPAASWTPLGPNPISDSFYGTTNSGRVTGFAIAPGSPQALYLASAGGGVWSSTNNGATWATNTDLQPDIAMGSISVDPSSTADIFAGTGEDNECLDCYYGDGILESTNSGSTWSLSNPGGVFTGVDVSSLAVEPGASSLATTTVLAGTSAGLYVSSNGGSTWSAEAGTGWSNGNVYNVVLNALTSPITIYVSVTGVGIEESTTNGSSWKTLTSSPMISGSSFENAAIGIHPGTTAATTTLYASLGSYSGYLGMFKSTNGGATWSSLTVPLYTGQSYSYDSTTGDAGDQSWYDNVLTVSPTNANIVVAGGIAVVESTNGGGTWSNLNGGAYFGGGTNLVHPDFHSLTFDGSGNLYMGNDGGAWELNAAGVASPGSVTAANYTNLNTNLDITQFYPGTAQSGNAAMILGGAQDNGTSLYSSSNSPSTTWPNVLSGDGGNDVIDPANTKIQFAEADEVLYGTTDNWSTSTDLFAPKALGGPPSLVLGSSDWVPPLALVSTTGPTLMVGGNVVYTSTNGGSTWSSAATSYSSSEVSALAVAPTNSSIIYAGFNDGTLQMSTNGGTTWVTLVSSGSSPILGKYITHIAVNSSNPDTAYLSLANAFPQYQSPQSPQVVAGTSLNTSPTWSNVTGNLPTGVATNSVVSNGAAGLIVASDAGVFTASVLNGSSTSWTEVGTNLPNSQVMDVLLNASGTLIATTHGRGVWTIPFSAGSGTAPAITAVSPKSGTTAGGTTVTITGTNFTGATKVLFSSTTAATSFTVNSSTQITAVSPAESAGIKNIFVTTPAGTSAVVTADQYTFK